MIGIGFAPLGFSLVGSGVPDQAQVSAPAVFIKADGSQGDAPLLALGPDNRLDYVLDASGQKVGASSIAMMLLFALRTSFDSSALDGFGLDLSQLAILSASAAKIADAQVRSALSDMVKQNLVAILSIGFSVSPANGSSGNALISISWMDLTTNQRNLTSFSPGT